MLKRGPSGLLSLVVTATLVLGACESGGRSGPQIAQRAGTVPAAREAPPAEVAALAEGSMSEEGKRVFYGASPKVLEKAEFGVACPEEELGEALGCFGGGRIFILRVTRPEVTGVMEVTAAHEMLHAVYASLSDLQRGRIDTLIAEFYTGVTDPDIRQLVEDYEPDERPDELHSILATEVAALSPVLEKHFSRFFTSRARVVEANLRYQAPLKELERRIDGLHAQIDDLEGQLKALDGRVTADEARLDELDGRLDAANRQGSSRVFNQLLPQRNALARSLSGMVDQYNGLVDSYNAKVDEINGLALEQDQLADGLSGKAPVPP